MRGRWPRWVYQQSTAAHTPGHHPDRANHQATVRGDRSASGLPPAGPGIVGKLSMAKPGGLQAPETGNLA
jgi:hypothetical protein